MPRSLHCAVPARRQFYANMITELTTWREVDFLEDLQLPLLRVLGLSRSVWGTRYPAMLRHIGPHLEGLSCTFDGDVLQGLCERHPSALRWLQLRSDWAGTSTADAEGLLRWIAERPLPLLRRLQLEGIIFTSPRQLEQAMYTLAQHAQLQRLRIDSSHLRVRGPALDAMTQMRPPAFPHLRYLHVAVESSAVPNLVRMLPHLSWLSLAAVVDAHAALPAVATLVALRSLAVAFMPQTDLAPADLLALKALAQLRELELRGGRALAVGEDHLQQLLVKLGNLHTLIYWVEVFDSPFLLTAIGRSCRQLRRLELWGEYSLGLAMSSCTARPCFPELEFLKVGCFTYVTGIPMRLVSRHCISYPTLASLFVAFSGERTSSPSEFSIAGAWSS